jgi:nucleotide-binding universal stress UspA family protein
MPNGRGWTVMRVLVTLDGSKFAEAVLGPAAGLSGASKAEVHLIQVVKPSEARTTRTMTGVGVPQSPGEMRWPAEFGGTIPKGVGGTAVEPGVPAEGRPLRQAEEYLADVAARFFPEGAVRKVVVGQNPAEEIAGYASREKVDLIAIATHGRTGLARVTMGSVAGELLKARAAPLFLVRPEGLFYATSA